jgi:hypothetical protein
MPSRRLTETEIAEARVVFGSGLDYTRARVIEGTRWPDWVDELGALMHGRRRGLIEHNAVTIGNTSYFPVMLETDANALAAGRLRDMAWLIHELTHQWQYQRMGWRYLAGAINVQVKEGRRGYDYKREHPSREAALDAAIRLGRRLRQFNLEQQGDIARDYYLAHRAGHDCTAWDPFIEEMR